MAESDKIVTQLEFEGLLSNAQLPSDLPKSVTMIQCIGPAEKFCSRLCCTTALKNALKLKELDPTTDITILYRDIRTYGFKEQLYTKAREAGIRFIQFEFDNKPDVKIIPLKIEKPDGSRYYPSARYPRP
jgi:heterodisulfide reductase subunit A